MQENSKLIATQSSIAQSAPYRSNRWRTFLTITLFSLNIVAGLIAISSDMSQVAIISRASQDEQLNLNGAETGIAFQQRIQFIQAGLFLVTGAVFLAWLYRAHKNLQSFGAKSLSTSSGFAVISFFIPIFNWVLPVVAVDEVWKASDPTITSGELWQQAKDSRLVVIWWLIFLGWGIARIVGSFFDSYSALLGQATIDYSHVVIDAFSIASALLSLMLVYQVNQRQEMKRHVL